MAPFRESIRRLAKGMQSCEEWLEMISNLNEPVEPGKAPDDLHMRWAQKEDRWLGLLK